MELYVRFVIVKWSQYLAARSDIKLENQDGTSCMAGLKPVNVIVSATRGPFLHFKRISSNLLEISDFANFTETVHLLFCNK